MGERLQKLLASRGIASRRDAEEMVASGRVVVNGSVAHVGQQVAPGDRILVDGDPIPDPRPHVYIALHKPRGVISASSSSRGDTSVVDLVPVPERLFPVGRLDKDSTGLIFLTNDGDWANLITHPRFQVAKEYDVLVQGIPGARDIEQLEGGVTLPDGTRTAPARIHSLGGVRDRRRFSVTVIEGKKRQIRLMFAAVGHPVLELTRTRIGPVELGTLPIGSWRRLRPEEVASVRGAALQHSTSSPRAPTADGDRRTGVRR